jgi:hypothetical protein
MPIRREVCKIERILHTSIEAPVSVEEVHHHVLQVRRSGTHGYPELVDARRAGVVDWTPRELMSLAWSAATTLRGHEMARRAVVVDSEANFGLARVFSSCVAGWMRVGVFTDRAAAHAWLTGRPFPMASGDDRDAGAAAITES